MNTTDTPLPVCLCVKPNKRSLWYQEPGLRYERCHTCGLIIRNPPPDMDSMTESFYEADYWSGSSESYRQAQREREQATISRLKDLMGTKSSGVPVEVLDIGCGLGVFLEEARNAGWSINGLEPSNHPANYTEELLGIKVERCFLEEANYPDQAFDIVHMNNVLEHVANPLDTLHEIHRILKPGGILYVEVPMETRRHNTVIVAVTKLFNRPFYPDRPNSFFDLAHSYIFNRQTLRKALLTTGFDVAYQRVEGWAERWPNVNRTPLTSLLQGILKIIHVDVYLLGAGYLMVWARKCSHDQTIALYHERETN